MHTHACVHTHRSAGFSGPLVSRLAVLLSRACCPWLPQACLAVSLFPGSGSGRGAWETRLPQVVSEATLSELNGVPHPPCLQLRSPQMQADISRWALFKGLWGLAQWLLSVTRVIIPFHGYREPAGFPGTAMMSRLQGTGLKPRPLSGGAFTRLLHLKSLLRS